MPQFIPDTDGEVPLPCPVSWAPKAESLVRWRDLDAFTQGYIEAMFFTWPEGEGDWVGGITSPAFGDLAPETLEIILADCAAFQTSPAWWEVERSGDCPDDRQGGRDFWFTRCGHGVGFWDGDWPEPHGDALTATAKTFGNLDPYLGDDGRIYLA